MLPEDLPVHRCRRFRITTAAALPFDVAAAPAAARKSPVHHRIQATSRSRLRRNDDHLAPPATKTGERSVAACLDWKCKKEVDQLKLRREEILLGLDEIGLWAVI